MEVIVYLNKKQTELDIFYLPDNFPRDDNKIIKEINKRYSEWFDYDII